MTVRVVAGLAVLAAALAAPLVASPYVLHLLVLVALFGAVAVAWNILGGFAGQMSLGHALFVGAGAYTSTALFLRWSVTPWLGMLAGSLLAATLGGTIGYVIFSRGLTGIYFALATLALAEIALYLVSNVPGLGTVNGLSIPPNADPAVLQFATKTGYYYAALALLGLALVVAAAVRRSSLGFRLAAIRENERAAAALGIDVVRGKVTATAISAGLAAMAGTLYAQYILFIDPESVFGITFSIEAIVNAFVGGVATVLGPLVGAALLVPISELLRAALGGRYAGVHLIVYGLVLIAVIRLAPEGVVGLLQRTRQRSQT